jgi:hypothetical protein
MGFIKRALFMSAAIAIAVLSAPPALAAPTPISNVTNKGLNIEISPLPITLEAKPGTTVTTDLRVRNSGTEPETLKVSVKTFSTEGPNGQVVIQEPTPNDEFVKWVSFDKKVFLAPPGQWQTVKMSVALPSSAAFGYYYAVQFELANPAKADPGTARLQGAVAIFVLLNAEAPGASRDIKVLTFKSDHSFYEFLPVNFTVRVRNTGNTHTAPHGNVFIKKGGKQIASLVVNPTDGMVLPKSNRAFYTSWRDGFPVYEAVTDGAGNPVKNAKGEVKTKLKWDFSKASKLRFGHYTADLLLVYNDGTRDIPISGTLSFWVVPWRLILFVIVIIVGPALAVYLIMRRRFKMKLQKELGKKNSHGKTD